MFNLKEIVILCREKGCEKFSSKAEYSNKDEGKFMITFISKTLNCRKINDWGRDEDTDMRVGLDENGWIIYCQTNHNGAGEFEIVNEKVKQVSDEFVIGYLESDECTNSDYLQFMKNAYEICGLIY